MYLIVYDIREGKRLKRTGKLLQRYGKRVQESVFECEISGNRYRELCGRLRKIRKTEDKIYSYYLGPDKKYEEI